MSQRVVVEIDAKDAGAFQEWQEQIRKGPVKYEEAVRKAGDSGKRAGKGIKEEFKGVGGTIGGLIGITSLWQAALIGIQTAQSAIIRAFDTIKERQKEIRGEFMDVGAAERAFAFAFREEEGGPKLGEAIQQVEETAAGVPLADAFRETEAALSARGALSIQDALDIAAEARRVRPAAETDDRKALGEAALEFRKVFGDEFSSAKEAIAAVLDILPAARTTDVGRLARNLAPGIAQARAFGGDQDDFRYLAAMQIGMGQRAGDPTGRFTSTGFLKLLGQVRSALLEDELITTDTSIEDQFKILRSAQGAQTRQRLAGAFADETGLTAQELQDRAARGELTGEAKVRIAMIESLSDNTKTLDMINAAYDQIAEDGQEAARRIKEVSAKLREEDRQVVLDTALREQQRAQIVRQEQPEKALQDVRAARFEERLKDMPFSDPTGIRSNVFRATQAMGASEQASKGAAGLAGTMIGPPILSLITSLIDMENEVTRQNAELRQRRRDSLQQQSLPDQPSEASEATRENTEAINRLSDAISDSGRNISDTPAPAGAKRIGN